jgi:hypothetical protein
VEADAAGLGGKGERVPRGEDVDALMTALRPWRAEVV